MRILLVNDYERAATGGDIHVYLVKKLLEERGHVVQRFTCGCTPGSVYTYFSRFFNLRYYLKMKRTLSSFEPEIIHAHGIHTCLSPSPLLAARGKIPIVITLHDSCYVCPKVWMIYEDGNICKSGFSKGCLFSRCYPKRIIFYDWMRWLKVLLGIHHFKIIETKGIYGLETALSNPLVRIMHILVEKLFSSMAQYILIRATAKKGNYTQIRRGT